jgi:hypothetical protein
LSQGDLPFTVLSSARPRRIAFLVDPSASDIGEILDSIADFSYETWGGVYNPIIPVHDGDLFPNFRALLEVADPDVFYSYAQIKEATISEISRRFNPTRMIQHRLGGGYDVWVMGQATTENEIVDSRGRSWAKRAAVITRHPEQEKDRFIDRNFGFSRLAYKLRAEGQQVAITLPTLNRQLLCKTVAQGSSISPRSLSFMAPKKNELAVSARRLGELLILYGDSAWNFIHFWNEAHRHGFSELPWRVEILWLPNELACSSGIEPVLDIIKEQLRHGLRDPALGIRILSYDHGPAETTAMGGLIENAFGNRVCLEVETMRPQDYDPGIVVPHRPTKPNSPQHDHVRGNRFFLLPPLRSPSTTQHDVWMADIRMESLDEGTNPVGWWALPMRRNLATLLHDHTPARIAIGGVLSVEVSTRTQKVEVRLPSSMEMFTELLTRQSEYFNTTDMRYPLREYPPERFVDISDKGKYFDGVVGLFGSLRIAGYWLTHPFWRGLLNEYSSPRSSDQALSKLEKDIAKSAEEFIKGYPSDKERAVSRLSATAMRSLRSIPQLRSTFTYQDLTKKWKAYLGAIPLGDQSAAQCESLEGSLAELTANKIFLQGYKIRCPKCLSTSWYHIDEVGAELPCQGCRQRIPLPIELPWSYQVNELVRTALREHGIDPVIRTSYRLIGEAKNFFRLLAGVELHEMADQETAPIGEFDICWVSDGKFGIAEVKTSAKDFTDNECAKIARLSAEVRPDEILIAATDGVDGNVERARSRIEKQVEGTVVRTFEPSSYRLPETL